MTASAASADLRMYGGVRLIFARYFLPYEGMAVKL
jgi:hypothetical protein